MRTKMATFTKLIFRTALAEQSNEIETRSHKHQAVAKLDVII